MQRHLWAYRNAFGRFAVDPEACEYKEDRVDTVEPVLTADTKHALLQQAEEAGYDIGMWLE